MLDDLNAKLEDVWLVNSDNFIMLDTATDGIWGDPILGAEGEIDGIEYEDDQSVPGNVVLPYPFAEIVERPATYVATVPMEVTLEADRYLLVSWWLKGPNDEDRSGIARVLVKQG